MFLTNIKELAVKLSFPTNEGISNPNLYLLRHINRDKERINADPHIKMGVNTQIKWNVSGEIREKDILRLEW